MGTEKGYVTRSCQQCRTNEVVSVTRSCQSNEVVSVFIVLMETKGD
jgi:hypothetical protein